MKITIEITRSKAQSEQIQPMGNTQISQPNPQKSCKDCKYFESVLHPSSTVSRWWRGLYCSAPHTHHGDHNKHNGRIRFSNFYKKESQQKDKASSVPLSDFQKMIIESI